MSKCQYNLSCEHVHRLTLPFIAEMSAQAKRANIVHNIIIFSLIYLSMKKKRKTHCFNTGLFSNATNAFLPLFLFRYFKYFFLRITAPFEIVRHVIQGIVGHVY